MKINITHVSVIVKVVNVADAVVLLPVMIMLVINNSNDDNTTKRKINIMLLTTIITRNIMMINSVFQESLGQRRKGELKKRDRKRWKVSRGQFLSFMCHCFLTSKLIR